MKELGITGDYRIVLEQYCPQCERRLDDGICHKCKLIWKFFEESTDVVYTEGVKDEK